MQITKTQSGGTIIYEAADWRAGLAPQGAFNNSSAIKYVGENGFSSITNMDPFNQYGVLAPGTKSSGTATNNSALAGEVSAFRYVNNSVGLGIDVGGKIQYITTSATIPVILASGGVFPHTIAYAAGTTYVGQDAILYRHNNGGTTAADSKVSFFYSAYNSNNWDIGAYLNVDNLPGASFDDDYMSSVPATPLDITTGDGDDVTQRTAPHPLEIGADGILYVGSGRYIHAYDGNTGNNGTFSSKVLTLPQGTQIIGMRKFNNVFLIAVNYYSNSSLSGTGQALLYTWDYISLDISSVTDLEDSLVSSLFIWGGATYVTTYGAISRNGVGKLKVISGNSVRTVASFNTAMPTQNGNVISGDVLYLNSGGYILSVGDRFSGGYAINNIASLTSITNSAVLIYNTTQLCLTGSTAQGSTYNFNNINLAKGEGNVYFPYISPGFPPGKVGRVTFVEVEYFQEVTAVAGNGDMSLVIRTDGGVATPNILSNVSSVTAPLTKRYTLTAANGPLPSFSSISPLVTWNQSNGSTNSPTLSKLVIAYELLDITN